MRTRCAVRGSGLAAIGAAAVASLAGCFLLPREPEVLAPPLMEAAEVTYNVVEASKATIESSVRIVGAFAASDERNLFFRHGSGRLKRYAVEVGDTVRAGQLIAELDSGDLAYRIAEQRLVLRKAELQEERTTMLGRDRYEQELAALDVQLARLRLDHLQEALDDLRLSSPSDGVVVYLRRLSEGDPVDAYLTVAQVADPKQLRLIYHGTDATRFLAGMKVTVTYRDRQYPGTVLSAPGSGLPRDAPEEMADAVVVSLPSTPPGAVRGDQAVIVHVFERRENVIVIPRDAVHNIQGRDFVLVVEGDERKEKTVELGITTFTEAEVVKGLQPGEQVIVR